MISIDEQIEYMESIVATSLLPTHMPKAILASLEKLKRIREVQVPEEPESVQYLRECVVARTRGESTLQYIDTLRDLLKKESARADSYVSGAELAAITILRERAEAAESKLAAMLKLGENPSEEMISAGLAAEGHIDDEFKAMFAKLVEQAGVKK